MDAVRIHWSLVLLAVIGTVSLTWHLRTKDMDFLTPSGAGLRPEDEMSRLVVALPSLQPELKKEVTPPAPPAEDAGEPAEPEISEVEEADLGDLEAAPGLAEYRGFARTHTPDQLFELSSTLRARGHFQRSLLALERIIDTVKDAPPEALAEAGQGIAALIPTLPRWNVDPKAEIPLVLHLSLARPTSEPLQNALTELTRLIHESSGDQVQVTPVLDSAGNQSASPDNPVALWLSSTDDEPVSSAVTTLRLPAEPDFLVPELAQALFQAVRSHLVPHGFPDPPELDLNGPQLLQTQITRLMWRDFARTLTTSEARDQDPDANDPAAPSSESD